MFFQERSMTAANTIAEKISSGEAEKTIGESIDKMLVNPKVKEWIQEIDMSSEKDVVELHNIIDKYLIVVIHIDNLPEYCNVKDYNQELPELYKYTAAVEKVLDKDKNEIGYVKVQFNSELLRSTPAVILFIIIAMTMVALFISRVFTMFMIIPIIHPIHHLEMKMKAIAEGNLEAATNTELVLKRPLREIESLMDSTNTIMRKLYGYNEILESQKVVLENQNSELEMQNEELMQSKLHIQEQQAQLIQSEKMASVGMLTAAITHEINTPIGAINSNAQLEEMVLLQMMNHEAIQSDEELNLIATQLKELNDVNLVACGRITEIIKSLKSYSRIDQADYQEANINEGIKSVLVLTNNLLKRRIVVHENYEDIPTIRCFAGQLNQVFMNIIVNASQAIEGEGEIFIHTYRKDDDVFISIKDTGSGIKQEDITKLFDPGFTTKGVGVGLGLGLYISYNIIQKHRGDIIVNSEPGMGAEFIIRIPMEINLT